MFTIIGADGKEYGPVTADKIREWIAAGRANAQTQCRREGAAAWAPLGAQEDFAGLFSSPAPTAGAFAPQPATPATAAPITAADILARTKPFSIGDCINSGIAVGKAHYFPFLGVSLLIGLCAGILGAIPFVGFIASLVLTGVFYGGLHFYTLQKSRHEPTDIGAAFSGFGPQFGQLALASIVVTLLTIVAFLCLILPGIYVAVCWGFTYLLVREKGLQFWDAMELGRQVVTRQWFSIFGLWLCVFGISLALLAIPIGLIIGGALNLEPNPALGIPLFGLGLCLCILVTLAIIPFYQGIYVRAYEQLFNPERP